MCSAGARSEGVLVGLFIMLIYACRVRNEIAHPGWCAGLAGWRFCFRSILLCLLQVMRGLVE